MHTPPQVIYQMPAGNLTLSVKSCRFDSELFRIAQRINPRRAFLFVSTVLGRHIPVMPSLHFRAVDCLTGQLDGKEVHERILVMSYAETAVGLGAAVARALSRRFTGREIFYLPSTRHSIPGMSWFSFQEAHSHAPVHHVMRPSFDSINNEMPSSLGNSVKKWRAPRPTTTLILVDDEVTTGATFRALLEELLSAGVQFDSLLLMTLTDWSDGQHLSLLAEYARTRMDRKFLSVRSFALMQGRWEWNADKHHTPPGIPQGSVSEAAEPWTPRPEQTHRLWTSPRLGISWASETAVTEAELSQERQQLDALIDCLNAQWKRHLSADAAEEILVIGTGEHVWGPMLLAERMEDRGMAVRFVATTRSPIIQDGPIAHKASFSDHFGLGIPMYLHNVPTQPRQRVVVLTEREASSIDASLRKHLGRGLIVDGSGQVTAFNS